MAYLDLDDSYVTPVTRRAQPVAAQAADVSTPASFSALEWSVIAIAQRDTLSSLTTPSRLSRALGGLFGSGPSSKLADPKLEALRRAAVWARHRGAALPLSEIDHFHSVGFSEEQLEVLVTSVIGLREAGTGRRAFA